MGVGASLALFAVGAILRFAVGVSPTGINVHEVGVIIMIVAAVGFVLSLLAWGTWGGFGGASGRRYHRETTVRSDPESGVTTRRDDAIF